MGRAARSPRSLPDRTTFSARATFAAISPWTLKTSERSASNASCQRVVGAPDASHLHELRRHADAARRPRLLPRTLATRSQPTPSSFAICSGGLVVALYWPELTLAMTVSPESAESLLRTSSVIPSAK